jgi:hypothetical protein
VNAGRQVVNKGLGNSELFNEFFEHFESHRDFNETLIKPSENTGDVHRAFFALKPNVTGEIKCLKKS